MIILDDACWPESTSKVISIHPGGTKTLYIFLNVAKQWTFTCCTIVAPLLLIFFSSGDKNEILKTLNQDLQDMTPTSCLTYFSWILGEPYEKHLNDTKVTLMRDSQTYILSFKRAGFERWMDVSLQGQHSNQWPAVCWSQFEHRLYWHNVHSRVEKGSKSEQRQAELR